MKRLCALIILVLLSLSAVGCTTVSIERRMNKDSSIEDIVTVEYDETIASQYGYSFEEISKVVEEYMTLNGYEIYSSESGKIVGRIYYATHAEFQESIPKGEETEPTEDGFFVDVYVTESASPYYSVIMKELNKKILESNFANVPISELANVSYVYKYSTPYESITSNGEVSEMNGIYTHTWSWSEDEIEDASIVVTQTIPDSTGWYVVAIAVAGVIVAVGFIIIGYRKGKGEDENG